MILSMSPGNLLGLALLVACAPAPRVERPPALAAQVAAYGPEPASQVAPSCPPAPRREVEPQHEARDGARPRPACRPLTDVTDRDRWPERRYRAVAHHLSCHPESLPSDGTVFFGAEHDVIASACNQSAFQRKEVASDDPSTFSFRLEPAVSTLKPCSSPELRTLALLESALLASEMVGYRGDTVFLLDRAGVPLLELVPETRGSQEP